MVPPQQEGSNPEKNLPKSMGNNNLTVTLSATKENAAPFTWQSNTGDKNRPNLEKLCRKAYTSDKIFKKILTHPKDHKSFEVKNGLIYHSANSETQRLCIPHSEFWGRKITKLVIDQVHQTVGHMGTHITENYARRYFWWPTLGTDIKLFCKSCLTCQATKTSNKRLQGLLHLLPIPTKPWLSIGIDFMGPFPQVSNLDYIWVVLCRLTSLVHLIPLTTTTMAAQLALLFMTNVVCLHGLPETIISNHDPKFTSLFWTVLHWLLGIKLMKSTMFHPQTNGASERMIQKVSQVMRTLVRPDQLNWPKHLPAVEFALNSSMCASTGYAPFEYIPQTIQSVGETIYTGVQDFANSTRDMVTRAHDALIAACIEQTHQANQRWQGDDPRLVVGNKAYLSTENLNLPKARARKLMPKYIRPCKIISCNKENSHYTLTLPNELLKCRIHPTFHAKLLRHAVPNDDNMCFPNREATSSMTSVMNPKGNGSLTHS